MKKILLCIIGFLLCINTVNADVKTFDRNTVENYGVKKHWKITNSNKDNILRTHLVDAKDKIYDFSNILTDSEEIYLKSLIDSYIKTTGMDLVILTEDFYNTTDEENEDYAVDFYDYNDFGMELDEEHYSGVIIFRNSNASMPYYGIYTFGEAQYYYPLEERLDYTLDSVYGYMTSHNYSNGFQYIINDLTEYYEMGEYSGYDNYYLNENGFLVQEYEVPYIGAMVIAGIATLIIILVNVNKNKMIRPERFATRYLDENSVRYSRSLDQFITSRTTSYRMSSSSGGGSSGGGSRGGSSGGGHGGGGRRG